MNNAFKKIAAGALAFALVLGCGGCGSSEPEVTELMEPKPTVHKEPLAPVTVSGGPVSPHLLQLNNLTAAPEYPQMPQRPRAEDYPEYAYCLWNLVSLSAAAHDAMHGRKTRKLTAAGLRWKNRTPPPSDPES